MRNPFKSFDYYYYYQPQLGYNLLKDEMTIFIGDIHTKDRVSIHERPTVSARNRMTTIHRRTFRVSWHSGSHAP